ncbi:hypothetical protein COU38_03100, partial [Candidatus Micrarchaeota archaeon CG10_big_fil_rev_8_21_14_0_10_54_18]
DRKKNSMAPFTKTLRCSCTSRLFMNDLYRKRYIIVIMRPSPNNGMQLLGNLDVFFLARELASLEGTRLDNAYQCGEKDFRFRFGKKDLAVRLGEYAFLGERQPAPLQPSQFSMLLRKHLRGRRLESIKQLGFDRLLELGFGGKSVVLELFSKGNLLLLEEGKIVRPFKFKEFSSRTLKPGETYFPPPSDKGDPRSCSLPSSGKAVPALSKKVNLAPFYLEEACSRAGVGFKEELDAEKSRRIREALGSLFTEELSSVVYFEGGKPFAFSPFKLKKFEGKEFKDFDSFSEALSRHYSSIGDAPEASPRDFIREQRLNALKEFEGKAAEARGAGSWISQNAFPVDEALALVRQGKLIEARKILGKKLSRVGRLLRVEDV